MLVKIFTTATSNELEYKINHFIHKSNFNIKDIKYCINYEQSSQQLLFSAMIIYEECKNE